MDLLFLGDSSVGDAIKIDLYLSLFMSKLWQKSSQIFFINHIAQIFWSFESCFTPYQIIK